MKSFRKISCTKNHFLSFSRAVKPLYTSKIRLASNNIYRDVDLAQIFYELLFFFLHLSHWWGKVVTRFYPREHGANSLFSLQSAAEE